MSDRNRVGYPVSLSLGAVTILLLLWGIYPLGGGTLPGLLSDKWSISFTNAAGIVSLCCSACAVATLMTWPPRRTRHDEGA